MLNACRSVSYTHLRAHGRKPAAVAELDLGAVADADFVAVGQALRGLPFVGSLGRPADATQKREEYRKSCFFHNA